MKLRVQHFPQIPCKPFEVLVDSLEQAKLIYETLGNYDLFQFDQRIKPDYCNVTIVQEWCMKEQCWFDYYDEDGNDFNDYLREDESND